MTNYAATKGTGDFTEPCHDEPTEQQVLNAMREHAAQVAQNALDSFGMDLKSALIKLAKYDDNDDLLVALYDSAKDLLERGEVK